MNLAQKTADFFLDHPNVVVTRRGLWKCIWDDGPYIPECANTLQATVSMARKLVPGRIRVVRGIGYRYVDKT
jgi:DNA-binding response OmpR family regulator